MFYLGKDVMVLGGIWGSSRYKWIYSYGTETIIPFAASAVRAKIKSISEKDIKDEAVFYFGKTSSFPRFKLAESNYKRCIKIEKADYVVIGDIDFKGSYTNWYMVEDGEKYYFFNSSDGNRVDDSNYPSDPFNTLKKLGALSENAKLVHKGDFVSVLKDASLDVFNIMNGTYKKLVTDKQVDKALNKGFDTMTEYDVKSITEMLESTDNATVGLGLKMLCGYNVQETPLTVRTLLSIHPNLGYCPEFKSVGVKQVLESVAFNGFCRLPYYSASIIGSGTYTDYDKSLCEKIYIDSVKKYMEIEANKFNTLCKAFGLKISVDVSSNSGVKK